MSLKIKYNNYEFPIMPTFNPSMTVEYDTNYNASIITEVWNMETAFHDEGASTLMGLFNTMEAALKVDNGTLELLSGSTSLRKIDPANCVSGPRVTAYAITEPREAALCTNLQISVTIEVKYAAVSTDTWLVSERNMTYSVNNEGILSISENSKYRRNPKFGNVTPMTIPRMGFNPNTGYNNFTEDISYAYSEGGQVITVTANWVQIRCNYPADWVASGNYSISEKFDQGLVEVTCSGSFVVKHSTKSKGSIAIPSPEPSRNLGKVSAGIQDIADSYVNNLLQWVKDNFSADSIVEDSISYDPFTGNLGFSLKWYRSISGQSSICIFKQSFSVNENVQKRNIIETLDGLPVVQKGGWSGFNVTHSGSVTGINAMPKKPEPEWPDFLVQQPSYNYNEPQTDRKNNYVMYTITFSHVYWFPTLSDMATDVNAAFNTVKDKYMPNVQR